MTDPITSFGLSLLSGYIANMTAAPAMGRLRWLAQQFNSARSAGELPENDHIERGTSRASLRATQVCIQRLIFTRQETFLDDIAQTASYGDTVVKRDESSRDPNRHTTARQTLDLTFSMLRKQKQL